MIDNTPLTVDEALDGSGGRHHGHRVCDLGEDGDKFLIEGHVTDADVRLVIDAYQASNHLSGLNDGELGKVRRVWAQFLPHLDGHDDEVCEACRGDNHKACADLSGAACCECSEADHDWTCTGCDQFNWWLDVHSGQDFPATGLPGYLRGHGRGPLMGAIPNSAQRAQPRTFLSGFCNPANPPEAHERCKTATKSGLMCRCSCHPHQVVIYPERKGHTVECRCGWIRHEPDDHRARSTGRAHTKEKNP